MDRLNHFRVGISSNSEITNHNIRLSDDVKSLRFMGDSLYTSLDPATSVLLHGNPRSSPLANY